MKISPTLMLVRFFVSIQAHFFCMPKEIDFFIISGNNSLTGTINARIAEMKSIRVLFLGALLLQFQSNIIIYCLEATS